VNAKTAYQKENNHSSWSTENGGIYTVDKPL